PACAGGTHFPGAVIMGPAFARTVWDSQSPRPAPQRALTHPKPVGYLGDEIRLRPAGKPLVSLLVGADGTQSGGGERIDSAHPGGEPLRILPLGAAIGERECASQSRGEQRRRQ